LTGNPRPFIGPGIFIFTPGSITEPGAFYFLVISHQEERDIACSIAPSMKENL